jgi:hypothetical protein
MGMPLHVGLTYENKHLGWITSEGEGRQGDPIKETSQSPDEGHWL